MRWSIFLKANLLVAQLLVGGLLITVAALPAAAQSPATQSQATRAPHVGMWLTEGGKSRVEVSDCGGEICAKIVWLQQPNDDKGKPLHDGYNTDARQRTRPILGLPLFETMRPAKAGWQGRIYNPEEGEYYDVTVWLAGADKLMIKGCVLFVCETHSWDRAPAGAAAVQAPPVQSAPVRSPPVR